MKRILLAALLFLLLLAAVLGVWLGYPAYKKRDAQHSLQQAEAYLASADYRQASLCARKVLMVFPTNLEATRIMARISQATDGPDAVKWWQRIVQLEPQPLTNRLRLAELALSQKNVGVAHAALAGASATDQATREFHQLAAMVAAATGQLDQAETHFSQALALDPDNHVLQLNLAVLQIRSTNAALAQAAEQTLDALSREADTRRDALRQLVQLARVKHGLDQAQAYSSQLAAETNATFGDKLLHLSILSEMGGTGAGQYLDQLQRDAESVPDAILALNTWRIAHDQAEAALAWLNQLPHAAKTERPVMLAMADGYAATKNWSQLQALLEGQEWGDLEFMRQAFLSRAASERGQFITARSQWRLAVREAGAQLEALRSLLRMTTAWSWDTDREDLLWTIVQKFPREFWALKDLEKWYLVQANTRGLLKVYTQQASLNPKDLSAKNNLATTSLLLQTHLSEAHELAQTVFESAPQNPAFASTYAFSRHLQGQTLDGLKVLEAFKPEMLEHPALSVYYGVMLAAAGDTNRARRYLEIARLARLLPEEKALVEAALKGPPAATDQF